MGNNGDDRGAGSGRLAKSGHDRRRCLDLARPLRRPVVTALAYVGGAYFIVLAVGAGLYLGSEQVGRVVESGASWVRRGALLLAAVILITSAIRRLRPRSRTAVTLPKWLGPWTAAPLGVFATAADLPNAFPYLLAIERLNAAEISTAVAISVLAMYAFVYCIPCLLLLLAGSIWHQRITNKLQHLYDRLGGARDQPRSLPMAAALLLLAIGLAAVAVTV